MPWTLAEIFRTRRFQKDERVVRIENLNFRHFKREVITENVELVTIDVSFVSIKRIFEVVAEEFSENPSVLGLLKPQFEAPAKCLRKGVVKKRKTPLCALMKSGISLLNSDLTPLRRIRLR